MFAAESSGPSSGKGCEESIMIVPGARAGELPVVVGAVGIWTERWPTDCASGVLRHIYLPAERYIE